MEYSVKAPIRNLSDPMFMPLVDRNSKADIHSLPFQLGRIAKRMDEAVGKFLKRYLIIAAELEEMKRDFIGQAAIITDYLKLTMQEIRLDKYDDFHSGLSTPTLPYSPNYEQRCLKSADNKLSKSYSHRQNPKLFPLSPLKISTNSNSKRKTNEINQSSKRNMPNQDNEQANPILNKKKNQIGQGPGAFNTNRPSNYPIINNNIQNEEEDKSTKRLTKKVMRHFAFNCPALNHNTNKLRHKKEEVEQEVVESVHSNSNRDNYKEDECVAFGLQGNNRQSNKDEVYSYSARQQQQHNHNNKDNAEQRPCQKPRKEVHFNQSPLHYSYEKKCDSKSPNDSFIKAMQILLKSPLLSVNEKLKLCSLNEAISTSVNPVDILNDSLREIAKRINALEKDKESQTKEENASFPSKAALASLNLLTKEKESHLIRSNTPINQELFLIICECLSVSSSSSSLSEGYNRLFKTFNAKSISKNISILIIVLESLFINAIYPEIFNPNQPGRSDNSSRIISIIHSNRELISQSLKTKSSQTPFSCLAFSLDEIYHQLKSSKTDCKIGKREMYLKNLKNKREAIMNKINSFND